MMMKGGKVDKQGEVPGDLEVSKPDLQMIGSNESDVSCL